jgi:shikimate kinase
MCIAEIFKTKGEKYFRKIEADIIRNIPSDNTVVSLGGGAFENSDTRDFLLSGNNTVIYLKTSAQKIYERIKNDTTRPLLTDNMNIETIQNMLNIREKNYKLAHFTIITDNKHIEDVVRDIVKCASLK